MLLHFNASTATTTAPMLAFFDSGIGGLSVLQGLLKQAPHLNYVFFADSEYFPYGDQPLEFTRHRVKQLLDDVAQRYPNIKGFILACNTATAACYPDLIAANYPFEIYQPVKTVCQAIEQQLPQKSTVMLIATPATVNAGIYPKALPGYNTVQLAMPLLAKAAEENWPEQSDSFKALLKEINLAILQHQPQGIILGSTHYHWLQHKLAPVIPEGVVVFDTAHYLTQACLSIINTHPQVCSTTPTQHILNTLPNAHFESFAAPLLANSAEEQAIR